MKITTVLFDLDGTLLPMDQEIFTKAYFGGIAKKLVPYGYDKDELFNAIWAGTRAMVKNTGKHNNEAVFWNAFSDLLGEQAKKDIYLLDEFYANDFRYVQASCGFSPKAREVINRVKEKNLRVALATNPLFPATATEQRIGWAGLDPSDFEFFTTYENSYHCKPNPQYYVDVMNALGVTAEECLMVGNDVDEDMIARELGAKVFLLTDCLINKSGKDVSQYPNGSFDDLIEFINML